MNINFLPKEVQDAVKEVAEYWDVPIGEAVERLIAYGLVRAIGDVPGHAIADFIIKAIEKWLEHEE